MNTDIRLSVDFFSHHKTKRVMRKLGGDGVAALVSLFCYAGKFRPDGTLKGMDCEDIADAVGWKGDAETLVSTLCEVGFVELCEEGVYSIHDWEEHNPWAAGESARKESASKAGKASAAKRAVSSTDVQRESTNRSTDVQRTFSEPFNGNPTPLPYPLPYPLKEKDIVEQSPTPDEPNGDSKPKEKTTIPYSEIIDILNSECKTQFKASTKATRNLIKARWNEGWRAEDFAEVIATKWAEWGPDPKMFMFLRPETLFGTKFESYLQAARSAGGLVRAACGAERCPSCIHKDAEVCQDKPAEKRINCTYFQEFEAA